MGTVSSCPEHGPKETPRAWLLLLALPLVPWGDTAAPCGSYKVCWLLLGLQRPPPWSVPSRQLGLP